MTIHNKMFDKETLIVSDKSSISVSVSQEGVVMVSFCNDLTPNPVSIELSVSDAIELEASFRSAINKALQRDRTVKVATARTDKKLEDQMYDVFSMKAPNDPVDW